MFPLRRATSSLVTKSLRFVNNIIQSISSNGGGYHHANINHSKIQNLYFKSKIMVLIALMLFATSILLSNILTFSVENYNTFIDKSKKLDLYLDLDRRFFKSRDFLAQFKTSDANYEYYGDYTELIHTYRSELSPEHYRQEDIYNNVFNSNYSSTALLAYLQDIYINQADPEGYLNEHKIPFHWGDWVDISPALPFVKAYDDILHHEPFRGNENKLYNAMHQICYDEIYDVKKPWVDDILHNRRTTVFEQLQDIGICSAIFKYYYWPIPERVLFESDVKYFHLKTREKRLLHPLGLNGLSKIYHKRSDSSPDSILLDEFIQAAHEKRGDMMRGLLDAYESRGFPMDPISLKEEIAQNQSDFEKPDFPALLKKYESIEKPTREDIKYLKFLQFSQKNVEHANKFFYVFPFIKADGQFELHHYTFPWIKQVISHEERSQVIHHLIRSWFKFAEQAGVISWFNFGNLIGWYFNSMNLPWDNDVDVQVSIKDQDKLGRFFNNTLVVEDPQHGDHLFWFQTTPFYMQHNPKQFIDSRYIDIKSGIYIDISALWYDNENKPDNVHIEEGEKALHCKQFNWFAYSEIFPVKRTLYEGAQAYMVNDPVKVLLKKYGKHAIEQRNEKEHNWQGDLGLWVPNNVCEKGAIPPTEQRFDKDGELTLFGACNNTELLEEYKKTRESWAVHQKEQELLKKGESTAELTKKSLPIFKHFSHEDYR